MFKERKFTFSLPVLAAFLFVLLAVSIYAMNRRFAVPFIESAPLSLFVLALIAFLVSAAFRALFPIYVGPEGVRATDGIGRYHEARWDAIQSVSTFVGFLWVRHGRPGAALTIPIFLDDGRGFRDYVLTQAPSGNPLRTYFEAR